MMLLCINNVTNLVNFMSPLERYFDKVLGITVCLRCFSERELKGLPLYLRGLYTVHKAQLFQRDILFLQQKESDRLTAEQYRKHTESVEKKLNLPAVLILPPIEAYNRKRLIEKHVAFIIPGKQMFIPHLLIDLKEFRSATQKKLERVQPAAQCLLLFHLLKKGVEDMNFQKIAEKLHYTPMTISRAIHNLVEKEICHIEGTKSKRVVFENESKATWEKALSYLQSPVKQSLYVEEHIDPNLLYKTTSSALPYYTALAEDPIECYAISQADYLALKEAGQLGVTNSVEGRIRLEIWKYAPGILAENQIVDPLSLYLICQESEDERVETEIEKMVAKLW